MIGKTAIVLGGSGLIGKELVGLLAASERYSCVKLLSRRPLEIAHPKIEVIVTDLSRIKQDPALMKGDEVFCCIGTTMKKAGSKENFRKVDYDIPVDAARAAQMYAKQFLLVSSIGASPRSGNFYLRTKGEVEKQVLGTTLPTIHILRPSVLLGDREESRPGEKFGKVLTKIIGPLLWGKLSSYRGIEARTVAEALVILAAREKTGKYFYESKDIKDIVTGNERSGNVLPTI